MIWYRVEKNLRDAQKGQIQLFMNEMNLGEVFYQIAKLKGIECAEEKISEILTLRINWILPDRRRILESARFKSRYPISYADAFLLATCKSIEGSLLTGDPEFEALKDEIDIIWLPRKKTPK